MRITTKLCMMVTYGHLLWWWTERLERLNWKSYDSIIMRSFEITWHTKIIVHSRRKCLWPTNLTGWGYTMTQWGASFHKVTRTFDNIHGLARSFEILDLLYLYYQKACGHQTWHGGDFLWEASTHKVTKPFENVATWVT